MRKFENSMEVVFSAGMHCAIKLRGLAGWELVAVVEKAHSDQWVLFYKRELPREELQG